MIHKEIYTER